MCDNDVTVIAFATPQRTSCDDGVQTDRYRGLALLVRFSRGTKSLTGSAQFKPDRRVVRRLFHAAQIVIHTCRLDPRLQPV